MTTNNVRFLCSTLNHFQKAGIALWVFGRWAEELWQMIPARPHNDIDLLYPAASFELLNEIIATESVFSEIRQKSFSHKRAIIFEGVMFEFILVQKNGISSVTPFFDGLYQFQWPADTFDHAVDIGQDRVAVASRAALMSYRQNHAAIEHAYTIHLATDA